MNKLNNSKAFTLIELIVVVGIIGILVGVASPRFTGFTKNAEVAAMKADTKALSEAANTYKIEEEEWPTSDVNAGNLSGLLSSLEKEDNKDNFKRLDKELMKNYISSTKNDMDEYVLATDGNYEGFVFHEDGKVDKDNMRHYWHGDGYENTGQVENDGAVTPDSSDQGVQDGNDDEDSKLDRIDGFSEVEIDELVKGGYIPISSADDLNNIKSNSAQVFGLGTKWENEYTPSLDGKFIQIADIDLSKSGYWTPIGRPINVKEDDYSPFGDKKGNFTGVYNGGGNKIVGLKVSGGDVRGLFGIVNDGALIKNVGIDGGSVNGENYVGSIAGVISRSTIENSYSTAHIFKGKKINGGLVGLATNSSVIKNSYTAGEVGESFSAGGLVGELSHRASIKNSYSIAKVTGVGDKGKGKGGLVGQAAEISSISNSYSNSIMFGNYVDESGDDISGGILPEDYKAKTDAELKKRSTYIGWDFENTWEIKDGQYPTLRWE